MLQNSEEKKGISSFFYGTMATTRGACKQLLHTTWGDRDSPKSILMQLLQHITSIGVDKFEIKLTNKHNTSFCARRNGEGCNQSGRRAGKSVSQGSDVFPRSIR